MTYFSDIGGWVKLAYSFIYCFVLTISFHAFAQPEIEKELNELRELGWKIYRKEIVLTKKEKEEICKNTSLKINEYLNYYKIDHYVNDSYEVVINSGNSLLGELAKYVALMANDKILYSPSQTLDHPYAAASYQFKIGMVLSDESIINLSTEDQTINHELVHMKTWNQLKNDQPNFYNGKISGGPIAPGALYFDEMLAYFQDVEHAMIKMKNILDKFDNSQKINFFSSKNIDLIFEKYFSKENPDFPLPRIPNTTMEESLYELILSRMFHGIDHSRPILEINLDQLKSVSFYISQEYDNYFGINLKQKDSRESLNIVFYVKTPPVNLQNYFFENWIQVTKKSENFINCFNKIKDKFKHIYQSKNPDERLGIFNSIKINKIYECKDISSLNKFN